MTVSDTPDPRTSGVTVSVATAAQLLGVSPTTVYAWIRDGRLQARVTSTGARRRWLVEAGSLDKLRLELAQQVFSPSGVAGGRPVEPRVMPGPPAAAWTSTSQSRVGDLVTKEVAAERDRWRARSSQLEAEAACLRAAIQELVQAHDLQAKSADYLRSALGWHQRALEQRHVDELLER